MLYAGAGDRKGRPYAPHPPARARRGGYHPPAGRLRRAAKKCHSEAMKWPWNLADYGSLSSCSGAGYKPQPYRNRKDSTPLRGSE